MKIATDAHALSLHAAGFVKYSRDLADFQRQMMRTEQIVLASAHVCNEHAPIDQRLKAAEYLIQLWNPYPFDRKAKLALRFAGPCGRDEIRKDLPIALLSNAVESVRKLKPRRIGRAWLKDKADQRVKLSLADLEVEHFLRGLRTLSIRTYEQLALSAAPTAISREVRDSDAYCGEPANSTGSDAPSLDDLEEQLAALSPRERQLFELLGQGMSKASAAGRMRISTSTARVLFSRLKKKLHK
jgi:DNA-directed RNA polymerase specialized sigma24 family protein